MESSLPLLLFFGFLFGGVTFILAMACWSRLLEEEEAQASPPDGLAALGSRPFLAVSPLNGGEGAAGLCSDDLVDGVESFLRSEYSVAHEFLERPTVERLHGHPLWERRFGDSVRSRVEGWLQDELRSVDEFLRDPTVERLLPVGPGGGER